jgi:ubiquinone/menaquinone biosynthesis C-methylase UbiE
MQDRPHDDRQRRAAWSRYWKQDVLHSLPGSFAGNYEGAIGRFWLRHLSALGAGHRILDIATGNGAIPRLACKACAGDMPRIDAIDLAEVSPDWLSAQPAACRDALRFHSGVSAEALPFPDGSFDLATSQYGIEYCDDARTVPELARVLRPGGRVALLVHQRGSRLVEVAREELRLADWLLRPSGFVDGLEAVVPWIAQAASADGRERLRGNPDANRARDDFNRGMQALGTVAAASPFPDLLEEARAFSAQALRALQAQPASAILDRCREYRESLRDARLRYAELCDCAMDESRLAAFAGRLASHGMVDIEDAPIHHDGMLMGWTLTARKPGADGDTPASPP